MAFWAIDKALLIGPSSMAIEQSSKPTIARGDAVVLFDRSGGKVVFSAHGVVEATSIEVFQNGLIHFEATFVRITPLEPARLLTDFTYSLQKVYRYSEPWRHFQRRYIALGSEDFSTLVEARIFWARTAFGTYLDSLPEAALAEFVVQVGTNGPRLLIDQGTFGALWKELREFVTGQYLGAHDLAEAIAAVAHSLEAGMEGFSYRALRLGDNDDTDGDLIYLQEERLRAFADSLRRNTDDEQALLGRIDERIAENETLELRFEEMFRGTPWPTPKMPH